MVGIENKKVFGQRVGEIEVKENMSEEKQRTDEYVDFIGKKIRVEISYGDKSRGLEGVLEKETSTQIFLSEAIDHEYYDYESSYCAIPKDRIIYVYVIDEKDERDLGYFK